MQKEARVAILKNRISLIEGKGKSSSNLIRSLKRELKKIENQ